uniref:hypothetical protein n=1 Tax=Zymomonas mobilis TaxID=542 RepID=UPI00209052AA|nr:hypothetical protein [Zymomonas mobilis]
MKRPNLSTKGLPSKDVEEGDEGNGSVEESGKMVARNGEAKDGEDEAEIAKDKSAASKGDTRLGDIEDNSADNGAGARLGFGERTEVSDMFTEEAESEEDKSALSEGDIGDDATK